MSEEAENKKEQVLVADDDPSILRLVKATLERQGFEVITANDGRDVYRLLASREPFAGAILDVMMPYITGTDLVKHMRTDRRLMKIPVVIMTAEQNPVLAAESLSSGAVGFLPKPFTVSQLQTVVRAFMRHEPVVAGAATATE